MEGGGKRPENRGRYVTLLYRPGGDPQLDAFAAARPYARASSQGAIRRRRVAIPFRKRTPGAGCIPALPELVVAHDGRLPRSQPDGPLESRAHSEQHGGLPGAVSRGGWLRARPARAAGRSRSAAARG